MLSFFKNNNDEESIMHGLQCGGRERGVQERKLYETFFYFIRQGMRKYTLSEDDAASAYSDTIISVINNVVNHKFEGRSSLKSYTYQIFMNKCVDCVRKETTNKNIVNQAAPIESLAHELPDKAKTVIQQIISKNELSYILEKIKEIGEKCRKLLLLFEDGYSDKEIADELKYNSGDVVKTSRLRCLEKLRTKIFDKNR